MAWADGSVDDNERSMLLSWATELRLSEPDASWRLLEDWLAKASSRELLVAWNSDYVGRLSPTLSPEAEREHKLVLLGRTRAVAQAAGAFSGVGQTLSNVQRAVMDEIESAFPS